MIVKDLSLHEHAQDIHQDRVNAVVEDPPTAALPAVRLKPKI
jgi:hypothetical protein